MAELTITVDAELLDRARVRALEEGTSLEVLLREHLEAYVGQQQMHRALADFAVLASGSEASSGSPDRTWDRGELHDRTT